MTDRPALIRAALRRLVADRGFHGTSMAAVAKEAGVATGTAYVHYESKDELVIDAYRELKEELLAASAVDVDLGLSPEPRFAALWHNIHNFLLESPHRARFLLQVEASPYATTAHHAAIEQLGPPGDPLTAAMADTADRIVDLPPLVLFDLVVGPSVRLVASGEKLDGAGLDRLAAACWRAAIAQP